MISKKLRHGNGTEYSAQGKIFRKLCLGAGLIAAFMLAGCSAGKTEEGRAEGQSRSGEAADVRQEGVEAKDDGQKQMEAGLSYESAKDASVDIKALQMENPDVFAWLYLPGTEIDYPVLQSEEADDYYESRNAFGEVSGEGALYTELANLKNMCDFNTVIHGKTSDGGESGLFKDLYLFADPDFFDSHEEAYLYLDGNLLTYEIFAAYERENTSLIRTYDFTYIAGCQQFLDDMYGARTMGMNIRKGWENVTPYHFLITLTTRRGDNVDKQFVVVAALVGDAAGTIDRVVTE